MEEKVLIMSQFWDRYVRPRFDIFNRNLILKLNNGSTASLWKRVTLLVATPAIALCMINVFNSLDNERQDREFRQSRVPYEYMCRRNKRFPWGDGNRSLFHNPKTNRLSGDQEV